MAKKISNEQQRLLQDLSLEALRSLNTVYINESLFKPILLLLNELSIQQKEKVWATVNDGVSTDNLVSINSKQNFYRGRENMINILYALFKNAGAEIERRETKDVIK